MGLGDEIKKKLNPFSKKKKAEEPANEEGEKPVARVDVYPSEQELKIQTQQREKGQKVEMEREPIHSGVSHASPSSGFEDSAKMRELLFNPTPENLEMLCVTKKQHWITLAAAQTFNDVREAGETRRNGEYFSVASRFITHLDRRSISVQGNESNARNAILKVHEDMSGTDTENKRNMGMG